MKTVILDAKAVTGDELDFGSFRDFGELTVYEHETDEDETIRRIGDADIVISCKTLITARVIEACPKVRFLGILSTGYDAIDVECAAAHGIPVCNVPSYATYAVAQLTMSLLLEMCFMTGEHIRSVRNGDWIKADDFCYWLEPLTEPDGRTLGIIGYGRIGQTVARMAEAMGMNVIICSPHYENSVSYDELFARADVISLHCCLTPENINLINRESIAKMKDGVWIINTARGPLIKESDLVEALESGKVGKAALDVICGEPMRKDSPLIGVKNCIITPHIAWCSLECRKKIIDVTYDNIRSFLAGETINAVNMP